MPSPNHGGNYGPKFTAAQFIDAIPGTGGNVTTIARRVGTTWSTAKKYITKYPTIQQAYNNERESILDTAEDKLVEAVRMGDPWAVKFILSTIGKKRGYTDRLEVTGGEGGPIIIKYTGNADPGEL